jgi:hypothetical protein
MKTFLRVMAWIVGLPGLLILGLWIAELIHAGDPIDRKPYYVEQSPDGRHTIMVVYEPDFWSLFSIAMPGQGGAGNYPGIVMHHGCAGARTCARAGHHDADRTRGRDMAGR